MTPPDRWREAAREIRQAMKDADLVWSLISEGKLTGMLRRLFPAREEGWIRVEMGLPKPLKRVQILLDGRWAIGHLSNTKSWLDELDEKMEGSWTGSGRDSHFVSLKSNRVTHWQPLPEVSTESERQKEEK